MAAEILNKLRELQERNAYPMHMPGHKRVVDFIPFDSREFDYTEIEGLDNLHHPDGIIKTAQEQMAQLTGADASFMLVNGGSSGILAAILATVKEGDEILVATNCHKECVQCPYTFRSKANIYFSSNQCRGFSRWHKYF